MVSRATWIDYDGDGKLDLIVVGEWMPVRGSTRRTAGSWIARPRPASRAPAGWWTSIQAADLNGDGRPDLVLGNLGLNSYIRRRAGSRRGSMWADFFNTGTLAQISRRTATVSAIPWRDVTSFLARDAIAA